MTKAKYKFHMKTNISYAVKFRPFVLCFFFLQVTAKVSDISIRYIFLQNNKWKRKQICEMSFCLQDIIYNSSKWMTASY